ncbi:MAG: hypothetical protein RBS17_11250 [Coriobacteriia bacterium]|nr:hypothetical protein [Coriobacteriia bacterium]
MEIRQLWRVFLVERALARDYQTPYQLSSMIPAARNPILESLLPSLLHVKLASILDAALEEYLDTNEHTLPKGYRNDLNGRICYCSDSGLIDNGDDLHEVRGLRNDIGHEPDAGASWDDLDRDVCRVHHTLHHLGFVGPLQNFRVHGERSAMVKADEPGVLGRQTYTIRVMDGDKRAAEWSWTNTLYDD